MDENGRVMNYRDFVLKSGLRELNYSKSSACKIETGVPQGSILGPLLFLLYINDCTKASNILNLILFADDTNAFYSHNNITRLVEIVNAELSKLLNWFYANKLSLNIDKTCFILFNYGYYNPDVKINIGTNEITRVNSVNFLGVILDCKLSWEEHIKSICKKVARSIAILHRVKFKLSLSTLKTLYFSLIDPYLQYCNIVWGRNYDNRLNPLIILQKKSVRIISNSAFMAHTDPIFKEHKILKLENINKLQLGTFVYNFTKANLSKTFNNYWLYLYQIHRRNTRNKSNLYVNYYRTNLRKFSVYISGPLIWNQLPMTLRTSSSVSSFRHNYKNILYDR